MRGRHVVSALLPIVRRGAFIVIGAYGLFLPLAGAAAEPSLRTPQLAPSPEPSREPTLSPWQPSALPTCSGCEYWLVSSRHCDQRLETCQRCNYSVTYFDGRGGERASQLPDLFAALQPGVPVCLMVHGSFVEWESVREDSRQTAAWLRNSCPGRPLHIVFFTWPSDDTPAASLPINVLLLGRRAALNGLYVAELVSQVPDGHPVCLLGHSHGARTVVASLHAMGGGQVEGVVFGGGPYHQHRIRAVLAAAAFDHHWLNPGERYDRAIGRAEAILNLQNRRDFALGFYPLHRPFGAPAVGRTGFNDHARSELGSASGKLADCDVTPLVRLGHVWPHYYGQPMIAQAIVPYVFFSDGASDAALAPSRSRASISVRTESRTESLSAPKWAGHSNRR